MMEVILREDVQSLGKAGQLVRVKPGYARNFLLPRGLAFEATEGNKKRIDAEARARASKASAEKEEAKHFAESLKRLQERCNFIIIDAPPGLTDTSDQIMRASNLVVVPVIPSSLSQRSLDVIKEYVNRKNGPHVTLAPVFSMVDRRRAVHQSELQKYKAWPVIPMASAYEKMSEERKSIGELLPRSAAAVEAVAQLWRRIEKTLAK